VTRHIWGKHQLARWGHAGAEEAMSLLSALQQASPAVETSPNKSPGQFRHCFGMDGYCQPQASDRKH